MSQNLSQRILVVGGSADMAGQIATLNHQFDEDAVDWTASSEDAMRRLGQDRHPYVFALFDREADGSAPIEAVRFVRQDRSSPFPAMALAMIGDGVTSAEMSAAIRADCLSILCRPVPAQVLSNGIRNWPMDRGDFIVSGAYTGPDRRRVAKFAEIDRRMREYSIEQTVSSSVHNYDIAADATLFRFKRFPEEGTRLPPAIALRNGLQRSTIAPAQAQIVAKKREAMGMLGRQAGVMGDTWKQLEAELTEKALGQLNGQAVAATQLSAQRGLVLMTAVTRSMAKYSAGTYQLGRRLVGLLRVHLDGVNTALRHRIDDDGGPIGRNIISALKEAERRFSAPPSSAPSHRAAAGD